MINKILLDTNMLVYMSDSNSPHYISQPEKMLKNAQLYISDRSLLEFYRVLTGYLSFSSEKTLEIIHFYQSNDRFQILYSNEDVSYQTFNLALQYEAKSGKIFDIDLLSTAIVNKIDTIYTKNIKDFPNDTSIKIIDPTI
jgi:predicted nucleic acid-binding protein